jgi:hypothetical protein
MSTTVLCALLGVGCGHATDEPGPVARSEPSAPPIEDGGTPVQFVNESFIDLYPKFLLRKIPPGPKAALWRRYYGRWVRWTGTVVSFTPNGLTLKMRPETVTFDVSLFVDAPQRNQLRKRLHKGEHVTFVGRLDSYDDVFRTLYLVHGAVVF